MSWIWLIAFLASLAGVELEKSWECKRPGRFRDPEESQDSCELYVTCIPDPDEGFTMRNDQCASGYRFSPKYQRCLLGETCDNLEDFYSIEYQCKECGKFVNVKSQDCRQFVNCLRTTDPGVYIPIKQNCPKGQLFSAKSLTCVDKSEYQCPSAVLKFLSDFVCLGTGMYPDESVRNCRGYRLCSKDENEKLESKSFLCENYTIFSETEHKCVPADQYDCPDDDDFICPGIGRYPDKSSKMCETYHNCYENSEKKVRSMLFTCPGKTIFSAITSKCVAPSEYVCPSTWAELEISEEEDAVCQRSGRFSNENDTRCETYFLCTKNTKGSWIKVQLRCPAGNVFSTISNRCVHASNFSCPGSPATTTIEIVVSTTAPTSTEMVTPTTTFLPVPVETTVREDRPECEGAGRFHNTNDDTCTTYYLCALSSENILTRTLLSCPEGTLFSIDLNRCIQVDGHDECVSGILTVTTPVFYYEQSGDGLDNTDSVSQSSQSGSEDNEIDELAAIPTTITTILATYYEYPCTTTGRFADINSVDCKSYFLCKENYPGSITSLHLNCPEGMVFSRNINKCVISTKYLC
ncbi:uncharacterized protein LOC129755491 [Uranotaenia lowii]|uniref:uncharacterized protein LOC129755491 n=1 Tax=Uranotaenia lowii TaxID=190385 RepID=UPI00247881CF|nr:uncharacterized protein LOC129755491 [Uranotaenia lowii]